MQNATAVSKSDFSFLNQSDFRTKYGSGPTFDQIRFYVRGINCAKCVRKLENLATSHPGFKQVRVEFGKSLVNVEIDPKQISFTKVAEAISALGFDLVPLTPELAAEELQRHEDRRELIRLAI